MIDPKELRVGSVCLLMDYEKTHERGRLKKVLKPRIVTEYWLSYLCYNGYEEAMPVKVLASHLDLCRDLTRHGSLWYIDGVEYNIRERGMCFMVSHNECIDANFYVTHLHQLQNCYQLLTGAEMHVGEIVKSLLPVAAGFAKTRGNART